MQHRIELITQERHAPHIHTERNRSYDINFEKDNDHIDFVLKQIKKFGEKFSSYDHYDLRSFIGENEIGFVASWKGEVGIFIEIELNRNNISELETLKERDLFISNLRDYVPFNMISDYDKTELFITQHNGNMENGINFCSFTPIKLQNNIAVNPYHVDDFSEIEEAMFQLISLCS